MVGIRINAADGDFGSLRLLPLKQNDRRVESIGSLPIIEVVQLGHRYLDVRFCNRAANFDNPVNHRSSAGFSPSPSIAADA